MPVINQSMDDVLGMRSALEEADARAQSTQGKARKETGNVPLIASDTTTTKTSISHILFILHTVPLQSQITTEKIT